MTYTQKEEILARIRQARQAVRLQTLDEIGEANQANQDKLREANSHLQHAVKYINSCDTIT